MSHNFLFFSSLKTPNTFFNYLNDNKNECYLISHKNHFHPSAQNRLYIKKTFIHKYGFWRRFLFILPLKKFANLNSLVRHFIHLSVYFYENTFNNSQYTLCFFDYCNPNVTREACLSHTNLLEKKSYSEN